MTNLHPDQERNVVPPEQLQHQTVEAYYRLPEALYHEQGIGISVEELIRQQTLTAFDKAVQSRQEQIPILIEFDELVTQSPTTISFKKAMHTLVEGVYIVGRIPNSHRHTAEDSLLEDVLQLENNTGIYTHAGAKRGEDILYQAVQHELVVSTTSAVDLGAASDKIGNYNVFSGWGTPGEIKALVQQWNKEYFALYGKQPLSE